MTLTALQDLDQFLSKRGITNIFRDVDGNWRAGGYLRSNYTTAPTIPALVAKLQGVKP